MAYKISRKHYLGDYQMPSLRSRVFKRKPSAGQVIAYKMRQQKGQSLAETLIVMLAILMFFTAIPWLGRLLDINLNQLNASRYAAFQYTRQLDGINQEDLKQRFFTGVDKNWRDRQQQLIVNPEQIDIHIDRQHRLGAEMQAGMQAEYAGILRREWQVEDQGIVHVNMQVRPQYSQSLRQKNSGLGLDLEFFDHLHPQLRSHTAILSDAAHSSSDLQAHQRTAWSNQAWGSAADGSYEVGQKIQSYAAPVDQGFERPEPVFDWLQPWSGQLPGHHLQDKPFVE